MCISLKKRFIVPRGLHIRLGTDVGEWVGELRGSRLEAWMKSHKSEIAIT